MANNLRDKWLLIYQIYNKTIDIYNVDQTDSSKKMMEAVRVKYKEISIEYKKSINTGAPCGCSCLFVFKHVVMNVLFV